MGEEDFDSDDDTVDFGGNTKLTFQDILMTQFAKVTCFCNVEFRGGFYQSIPTKEGGEKLVYVPDTREVFCNGVLALVILMEPKFKEDMRKFYLKFRRILEKLKKKFIEKSTVNETVVLGENFYKKEEDKIALEEYKNKKLELYIKLFRRLSKQMKDNKYGQIMGGTF